MISLQEVMHAAQYKISEGSDYEWNWAGKDAYYLDFSADVSDINARTVTVVFDRKTQEVYSIEIFGSSKENKFYCWIKPSMMLTYENEGKSHGVDINTVLGQYSYVWIDDEDIIIELVRIAMSNESFDDFFKMEEICISLSETEVQQLRDLATFQKLTVNQMITILLKRLATSGNFDINDFKFF